jgi:hypothetical protein
MQRTSLAARATLRLSTLPNYNGKLRKAWTNVIETRQVKIDRPVLSLERELHTDSAISFEQEEMSEVQKQNWT